MTILANNAVNNSHLVDLGLPSGVLWQDHNLGASQSNDFGEYYLGTDDSSLASVLGVGYRIPTRDQFQELMDYTTQSWAEQSGIKGMRFTSSNGNSIFLPAAAQLWYNQEEGQPFWDINNEGSGAYWTCSPSDSKDYIYFVEFNDEEDEAFFGDRKQSSNRLPIRPIYFNPNSGITNIENDNRDFMVSTIGQTIIISSINESTFKCSLYDIAGHLILNKEVNRESSIGDLNKGIYILNVMFQNKSYSYKIRLL